jgi:hypothetical protein
VLPVVVAADGKVVGDHPRQCSAAADGWGETAPGSTSPYPADGSLTATTRFLRPNQLCFVAACLRVLDEKGKDMDIISQLMKAVMDIIMSFLGPFIDWFNQAIATTLA